MMPDFYKQYTLCGTLSYCNKSQYWIVDNFDGVIPFVFYFLVDYVLRYINKACVFIQHT